ncbi:hypothetical protein [uncultured Cohaesibacter sp.]|uniref:hypothetical protein n=1 Tax=uncultured Cohaesibacter sp. TaxID=1002546 RepID=UPI00293168E5|nr:hypothetical protein [uncultured Cohaesibacter sp.]
MSYRTRKWLLRIGLVLVVLYVGIQFFADFYIPRREIYYRLEVTFEVNGVPISGHGVQKLVVRRIPPILESAQMIWRVYGEAISINLPERGSIYILMASPTDEGIFTHSVKGGFDMLLKEACDLYQMQQRLSWAEYVRAIGEIKGTCVIALKDLPLMVHFKDRADPASVERVFPRHPESVFGQGVRFLSAQATITTAPISSGIKKQLKWLTDDTEHSLIKEAPSTTPSFPAIVLYGYFRRIQK